MIENYPNERRMHCESGVMVNMLEYYGYNISEEMVFGIGGGLYFLYFPWMKVQDFVLIVLRKKPGGIARQFAKRLHLNYHELTFGNNVEKGTQALDELVSRNIPVVVASNLRGLKYLNDIGFDLDYNGHHITVIGKEGNQYIIADMDEKLPNDDYVYLDEARLRSTRFRSGISAPHGRMFYLDPLPKDFATKVDLRSAVIEGLKEVSWNMLSIPIKYFGIKGIHYFANDMRKWHKKYTDDKIDYTLLWYYRLIEQAGTGGAGYRYMYADFLKESASLLQKESLQESGDLLATAADYWRQFTVGCNRYISRTGVTLNELADMVDEAGNKECEAFKKLKSSL